MSTRLEIRHRRLQIKLTETFVKRQTLFITGLTDKEVKALRPKIWHSGATSLAPRSTGYIATGMEHLPLAAHELSKLRRKKTLTLRVVGDSYNLSAGPKR